ncbi:MAG: ROK family protein [Clostridia bacterium]|nr:ROK family protein [Clostridia bacterium]
MYYLGIDLGGTNAAAGVVDENGKLIAKASVPTQAEKGVDAIIANIAESANQAIKAANLTASDIESIGIGTPGTLDAKTGVVEKASNLGFYETPLAELVGNYFPGKKVFIENDANVAALAEATSGAAKGTNLSVTVTLGTGIGGGLIMDGKIFTGANGRGGEFGHMVIESQGRQCTCGRKGCWEAYASVTGLINLTKEQMQQSPESVMWEIAGGSLDRVNGLTSFEGMRRGDKAAKAVVDKYLRYVAEGILDIINMLQPEVIVIGGGISKEGDTLLGPVSEIVTKEAFSGKTGTKLMIAKLGNDAGIIGAAMLRN